MGILLDIKLLNKKCFKIFKTEMVYLGWGVQKSEGFKHFWSQTWKTLSFRSQHPLVRLCWRWSRSWICWKHSLTFDKFRVRSLSRAWFDLLLLKLMHLTLQSSAVEGKAQLPPLSAGDDGSRQTLHCSEVPAERLSGPWPTPSTSTFWICLSLSRDIWTGIRLWGSVANYKAEVEKEAQVNPSREKRHVLNAKGFKQKTEGTVFKGRQMQVLGKASIWLFF